MNRMERFFDRAAEAAGFCGMACVCAFVAFGALGIDEIALPCILAALGFSVICAAGTALSGQQFFSGSEDVWWDDEDDGELWPDEEDAIDETGSNDWWEEQYVD